MKKLLLLGIIFTVCAFPGISAFCADTQNNVPDTKPQFGIGFISENIVSSAIKNALKKEAPGKYKIKFKGYSLGSIKKGIFKYLEITGKNIKTKDTEIPYFNIKSISNYNWIDYNQNPIVFKSDMEYDYVVHFSEKSINDALKTEEYEKTIRKVNKKVFPLLTVNKVTVKISNEKVYLLIDYNFPLAPMTDDKTVIVSSRLKVVNKEICACGIALENSYGNIPLQKVTGLVNVLNPLKFVQKLLNSENAEATVEEIKITDDIVIINGKIYIKGEE